MLDNPQPLQPICLKQEPSMQTLNQPKTFKLYIVNKAVEVLNILDTLPTGSRAVPFCGLCLGSYKVIPKRNYYGGYG